MVALGESGGTKSIFPWVPDVWTRVLRRWAARGCSLGRGAGAVLAITDFDRNLPFSGPKLTKIGLWVSLGAPKTFFRGSRTPGLGF